MDPRKIGYRLVAAIAVYAMLPFILLVVGPILLRVAVVLVIVLVAVRLYRRVFRG